MQSLVGTARLLRLALRRDRIKLPAWILTIVGILTINIPAITNFYAASAEDRLAYAVTNASSLIARLFNGPLGGPEIGEIITNETFMTAALLTAFMSTLTIVRHTRQNEETGRSELIGSAVVGRHAQLAAALLLTTGANIVLGALMSFTLIAQDLPMAGSVGFGATLAAIGICFSGIAAIAAQLSESARGANTIAGIAIGIFFLLRAAGDSLGQLTPDKMGVVSSWPSWMSPFGWAQQIHFYTKQDWWIFGLFVALFVIAITVAFVCNALRDVGSGMIPSRLGPAKAARSLLSPLGLAWKLQKGILKGWVVAVIIFGFTIGLVVKEFAKLFTENEDVAKFLNSQGFQGSYENVFFGGMLLYMCIISSAYAIQALQRMRIEEASGRLEPILGTSVSRYRWMLTHVVCVLGGTILLLFLLGLSTSLTYVLYADAAWAWVPKLITASLVHAPAIFVISGFVAATFALLPRATIAISWSAFGLYMVIGQFGELLKLPQLVRDISPFTHSPTAPAEAITVLPLLLLSGVAILLVGIALVWFRRRDIMES